MMQYKREQLLVLPDQPTVIFGRLRLLYWLRELSSPRVNVTINYILWPVLPGYCPVSTMVLEVDRNNRPILAGRLRRSIISCREMIRAWQFSLHALIQRRTA